jgi:hypothetical protein
MPVKSSATATKRKAPVAKKTSVKKTSVKKSPARKASPKKTAVKKAAAVAAPVADASVKPAKRPRDGVVHEDLDALVVDEGDIATREVIETARARKAESRRYRTPTGTHRSAVDRLDDPPPASGLALIARVSRAIEHELAQIETIVGGRHVPRAQRSEAERRARTLASLARTLNEVKRLRAEEEKPKAADDDVMPRDLDEFRRELSRRLALMEQGPAPLPDGGNE